MNVIKFSHEYLKMPDFQNDKPHFLVSVCKVDLNKLPESFLKYDTAFYGKAGSEFYFLDKKQTHLLLTLFNATMETCYTTIRRWTPEKEKYYMNLIGQEVKIEITKG